MNGYYPRQQQQQYGGDDLQNSSQNMMGLMSPDSVPNSALSGAQSFNDKAVRRRSMPMSYGGTQGVDASMRRMTMMDFSGSAPSGGLDSYQFDPSAVAGFDTTMANDMSNQMNNASRPRRSSQVDLSVNTQMSNQAMYGQIPQTGSAYASPMNMNGSLDMDLTSPYITSGLPMNMDFNMMSNDLSGVDLFSAQNFESPMVGSPMHTNFGGSAMGPTQDPGGGAIGDTKSSLVGSTENSVTPDFRGVPSRTGSHESNPQPSSTRGASTSAGAQSSQRLSMTPQMAQEMPPAMSINSFGPQVTPPSTGPEMIGGNVLPWSTPAGGWPSTLYNRPHIETAQFKDIYAPSGFDLLNILMRVATRPNPEINIGAVDLSCAFVVTDAKEHDNPILYCSESFERLTGYSRHEIQHQNCRFLQSPDGKVQAGIKRKYCDDDAVLYLKNSINTRAEAQISLINYRKGGQPFMNLLTMIPIFDDSGDVTHFVGFQVDLVERPNAINSKNPDGTYSVNYQRQPDLPGYFLNTPETNLLAEYSQTVPRDEVTAVLTTMSAGESELSKRIMDKVLLENSDDVIHVLSLKGLFLYLSPASRRVLEYDPSELVGTALSSVCHPSDIVPVTRELKDAASNTSVSVVFRIRRKRSGYMWFESHGSLHTEQGKGRKCIILIGRERPVYTLSRRDINAAGGIGEHELWTKMSTTGMYLFVSSNVRSLLDRQPEELVGTNIQQMMRPDSKQEFARILTIALAGKSCSVKHEMTNRKGQVIQAFSWIYPGDAMEGQKPTFLVVQTRLIKYHRGSGPQRPNTLPKQERNSATSIQSTASGASTNQTVGDETPLSVPLSGTSSQIDQKYQSTIPNPISHAGQNGLQIGRQDASLASDDNVFDELKTTRSTSWQYELRQMEKRNRILAEEVQSLMSAKKKRKRRRGAGLLQKDCANCHTKHTPEWRRGPSGNRDLCNSCGLRWAKQNGRVSPRTSSRQSVLSVQSDKASKASASPLSDQYGANNASSMTPVDPQLSQQPSKSIAPAAPAVSMDMMGASSPQQQNAVSHAAKVARMEVPADAAQGLAGGVPPKIEEGIEPD